MSLTGWDADKKLKLTIAASDVGSTGTATGTLTINNAGGGGATNTTYRTIIDSSIITRSGSKIKITLGRSTQDWSFGAMYVGHKGAGAYDFDGNQVQVTVGGSNSATISADGTETDEITFDLDASKDLVIAFYNTSAYTAFGTTTGVSSGYKASTNDAATTIASGYTSNTSGFGVKQISVTVAESLTDFPVLVNLGTSVGKGSFDASAVFDELTSDTNRKKIAVEIGDTGVQCYAEIERWDDANETAQLWVKIPSVSASADTILHLYYDSTQSDNTTYVGDTGDTPAQSAWNSDFVAAIKGSQDPSGGTDCILDSTSNEIHGTPANMAAGNLVDMDIGKGLDYNGTDESVSLGDPSEVDFGANDFAFSAIIQLDVTNAVQTFFGKDGLSARQFFMHFRTDTSKLRLQFIDTVTSTHTLDTANNIITDTDEHQVYGVRRGTALENYIDGSLSVSNTAAGTAIMASTATVLYIGQRSYTGSLNFMNGSIRDSRIMSVAPSADWIAVDYKSVTDALITFSLSGAPDRIIPSFTNIPKPYNINFMPSFATDRLIRQTRKGFSKAF